MEKPHENLEEKAPKEQYGDLINAYQNKFDEIKKIQRRLPPGVTDEEAAAAIRVIDQERHALHLQLIKLGERLGKNEYDVLADIIRKNKTLEEYGLPEFSILVENDIIRTDDWYYPYRFSVNPYAKDPYATTPEDFYNDMESNYGSDYLENHEYKSYIQPEEVMLVFAIIPTTKFGEEKRPQDYDERVSKANALAQKVGGQIFNSRDSGYHEATGRILGVIIPKKDVEKVAALIRNNPDAYRLGSEFYSQKTKHTLDLSRKINTAMEEITGYSWDMELPEPIEGTEALKNKTIALVDDDENVFRSFISDLIVATDGKTIFIPYKGESKQEVAEIILKSGANVALLDLYLSEGVRGNEIAATLKKEGFSGVIIGFSADKSANQIFKRSGARGTIYKDINSPQKAIQQLAQMLARR